MDTILSSVVVGLLVGVGTAYFSSRFYVHQATAELRADYRRRFNERRWKAYLGFSEMIVDLLKASTKGTVEGETGKMRDRLYEFMGELWIMGSDEVILDLLRWRRHTAEADASDPRVARQALELLVNVAVTMRRDLGETDSKVVVDHMLAMINDDYLRKIRL